MSFSKTFSAALLMLLFLNISCSTDDILISELSNQTNSTSLATVNLNDAKYQHLSSSETILLLENDEIDLSNEILIRINSYRSSIGLKSLNNNSTAKIQALSHSQYQANNNHISHDNSYSRTTELFVMENASSFGENVAFGYSDAEKLVEAWINSEKHKEIIEGNFTSSGIGTIANNRGVLYYTQIFFK